MKGIIVAILIFLVLPSCTKDQGSMEEFKTTPVTLDIPKRFPPPHISTENPLTAEGILLGRTLYYDDILSSNNRSCSSCHIREKSFSLPLFRTQFGEYKSVPPHLNLAWNPDYNWDGGESELDLLCLEDFGPDFFNTNMDDLVLKFKEHSEYPILFKRAFNIDDISTLSHKELQLKIVYSISQFLRTMISSDSRFDKWIRHEITFTEEELIGFDVFFSERGDCFHCHGYPLMTINTFVNNGLDSFHVNSGMGRSRVTGLDVDKGKFSVPTLRNVDLTAPYMHDGRFKTLEEVIDFYDKGVQQKSPNIDPIMTKPLKVYGLNLLPYQKKSLIAFLKTLTDTDFISNSEYRKPAH